jgi:molybdopterin-guanine dinucleotide biosynthesis protein A/N-acetylglutamate synthase-like GNAT family acetyltransferase
VAARALTGVLLVGGAGRRFGSPKALALLDGRTLAERAWRTLGETAAERIAVGKTADALDLPFPVTDDGADVRAPLAGVVAGLRAARNDLVVVLPVDMPLVRPADLRRLADECADAAVPEMGPLPCALRRMVLPVLEGRHARGELALRDALRELDTRTVAIEASTLANVNEPADLAALEVRIGPFRREHADGFRSLVSQTLAEYGFAPDPELDPDLEDPESVYEAVWVAIVADDVAGSVALRRAARREVELKRMYLRPELRGRGVGRRLLQMVLLWAREHGIERITLDTTEAMVAARRLYESHGFVRIGDAAPRQGQDRLLYELQL